MFQHIASRTWSAFEQFAATPAYGLSKNARKRRTKLSNGRSHGRVHISWYIVRFGPQNVAFSRTCCRLSRHRCTDCLGLASRSQNPRGTRFPAKNTAPWEIKCLRKHEFKKRESYPYSKNIAPWCRCSLHIVSAHFEQHNNTWPDSWMAQSIPSVAIPPAPTRENSKISFSSK